MKARLPSASLKFADMSSCSDVTGHPHGPISPMRRPHDSVQPMCCGRDGETVTVEGPPVVIEPKAPKRSGQKPNRVSGRAKTSSV
jgi:hypothetical protein